MNIANRITLVRVCLVPAFLVIFLAAPFIEWINAWIALVLFVAAAVTDAVDGYVARKYGLVTNFGKLMDPLADKFLICSVFIAFLAQGLLPVWAVILFVSREFFVSGVRQIMLEKQIIMAASNWGKIKTGVQITLIVYILLPPPFDFFVLNPVTFGLVIITVCVSIWSAVDYVIKNSSLFEEL